MQDPVEVKERFEEYAQECALEIRKSKCKWFATVIVPIIGLIIAVIALLLKK